MLNHRARLSERPIQRANHHNLRGPFDVDEFAYCWYSFANFIPLATRLQIVSPCNTFANCFLSSAICSPWRFFVCFFSFFLRSTECSPLTWTTTSWSPCGTTAVPRAERPASRTHTSSTPGPPSRTPSSTHTAACQVLTATPRWGTEDAGIKVLLLRTQRAPLLYIPWVRILVQIYVLPAMLCLSNF